VVETTGHENEMAQVLRSQVPGGPRNPSKGEDQQRIKRDKSMTSPDEPIELAPVAAEINELLDRADAAPDTGVIETYSEGQPVGNTLAEPVTTGGERGSVETLDDLTFGTPSKF
jgi:hypothetical protein